MKNLNNKNENARVHHLAKRVMLKETGVIFASGLDASRTTGVPQKRVSYSCRNITTTRSGFTFRFVDENGNPIETPMVSPKKGTGSKAPMPKHSLEVHKQTLVEVSGEHFSGASKATYELESGNIYASVWDAAVANGASRSEVSKCCRGVVNKAKGKTYRFVHKAHEHIEETMLYIRSINAERNMYKAKVDNLEGMIKAIADELHRAYEENNALNAKVNDPNYLAWLAEREKEREERRSALAAKMEEQREIIRRNEIALAKANELLEALAEEHEQLV